MLKQSFPDHHLASTLAAQCLLQAPTLEQSHHKLRPVVLTSAEAAEVPSVSSSPPAHVSQQSQACKANVRSLLSNSMWVYSVCMQFADIQASLEPATSSAKATSASRAASEAATSPTLSPDASQGLLQEASQGSLDQPHASGKYTVIALAKIIPGV